jgi:hypothetical protein
LVEPKSKRACNDWLENDAYFPEWDGWNVKTFYKALDVLHQHWSEVQERMGETLYDRLPEMDRELGLLLVDTTSQYFASKRDDKEVAEIAAEWEEHLFGGEEEEEPIFTEPQVVNEPPCGYRVTTRMVIPGSRKW